MQTRSQEFAALSEKSAAIVAELEAENDGLRKHVEYLRMVIEKGMAGVMAPDSGVFIPLPPPKEIAFGQRWAVVFTLEPDNDKMPSLDELYCPLYGPDGQPVQYRHFPIFELGTDYLLDHGLFLGTTEPKVSP